MPVDVHVPGCPPRPEALMHGILKLRSMIQQDPTMGWRMRYGAENTVEVLPEDVDRFDQETAVNVFEPGKAGGA
jgi:NADH-quinone oxidoreductase subunit B